MGRMARVGAWGVLLGGAAGFALGVLLAPEEGRKLRRKLAYQLENLADQVGTMVDHLLSPEAGGEARRRGDALVADARMKARRIQDDIDSLLGEIRQRRAPSKTSSTLE